MAEDTAGEEAAGPFYDAAQASFTSLVDPSHTLSALYGMVNVPTGVLIDEQGTIVRFDEGTYSRKYETGNLSFGTDDYVPMVRDWVNNGAASRFVRSPRQLREQLQSMSASEAKADAAFRLGSYHELQGDRARAERYWRDAQRLNPDSWNYHRQEWSYDAAAHGANWLAKYQELDGKPYYAPMALPGDAQP